MCAHRILSIGPSDTTTSSFFLRSSLMPLTFLRSFSFCDGAT